MSGCVCALHTVKAAAVLWLPLQPKWTIEGMDGELLKRGSPLVLSKSAKGKPWPGRGVLCTRNTSQTDMGGRGRTCRRTSV